MKGAPSAGAFQETVTCPLLGTADTSEGGPGRTVAAGPGPVEDLSQQKKSGIENNSPSFETLRKYRMPYSFVGYASLSLIIQPSGRGDQIIG